MLSMTSLETNRPIAFLDSGIGGIPYLSTLRHLLPRENYIYLADHQNFPYGDKSEEGIRQSVLGAVNVLIENQSPKMIVLACNTASVSALSYLRERVNIPVVGVVPAVKPAAKVSDKRCIGVLATERTINAPYLDKLIEQFADNCHVIRVAGGDIVSFVENKLLHSSREDQNSFIAPALDIFRDENVDTIVLGCTHFTYLEENIRSLSGGTMLPVDSREGVANQARRVLEEGNLLKKEGEGSSLYFTTKERTDRYGEKICSSFFLEYRGLLKGDLS